MWGTAKLSLMTPGGGNLTSSQGSVIIFKMFYWGKIYMSGNTLTLGVQFNELWQMYTTVKPTPWSKNKTYARPPNSACIFFPTIWQPRQPVLWLRPRGVILHDAEHRTNSRMWDVFFCVWLLWLNITSLGFIFGVVYVSNSYFWSRSSIYFMTWIYHDLMIHFPVDRHLSCLSFRAMINKAARNSLVQSFCGYVFSFLSLNS